MIKMTNLGFSYKKKPLFNNLSLEITDPGIYGLLGKNGAGKTSLLRLITGQLFPDEGTSFFKGLDAAKRSPQSLGAVYFVPEQFTLPPLTAKEYLSLYAPFYREFNYGKIDYILEQFEVEQKDRLQKLSFGQRKKFLLAFALATGAEVTIFDEPSNGLDIPSKTILRKLLSEFASDNRIFIISTHQVRDLEQLLDPIIIINDGTIILNKTIEELSSRLSVELKSTENEKALYTEKVPGGYAHLMRHQGELSGSIDLEVLFNACHIDPSILKEISNGI